MSKLEKQHAMHIEVRGYGLCEDTYCTGHSDEYLVCSCGHESKVFFPKNKDSVIIEHRLQVIQDHLGLSFTLGETKEVKCRS